VPPTLGGQDPKLFDLGQDRLLVLAGASYAERRGGINLQQQADAYMLDLSAAVNAAPVWQPVAVAGAPPMSLHGAFAGTFGDGVVADRIVTFAGGNHVDCHDDVSCLDLAGLPSSVVWQQSCPTPGPTPGPRYAGASAVWDGALLVIGGRSHGHFFGGEMIWALRQPNLTAPTWVGIATSGEAPSPRVWLSALVMGDRLVVYGGALWTFNSSCWGNDSPGTVWTCNLPDASWSRIQPPSSAPAPQMRAGAVTAMCGKHLLVYGGCDLARRRYLGDAWLLDLASEFQWTEMHVVDEELAGLRSHGVAITVPSRRAVIVFGGAQYLNGCYFRDVLQLNTDSRPAPLHASVRDRKECVTS